MPGSSSTERRADYAAAWTALGRPEPRLDEAALSDGQLLARWRAWPREQAWAPPHADDALRAAEQAAERARQDAALAEAEDRADDAARLRAEATASAAAAAGLAEAAEARSTWAARTAVTQAHGQAARAELAERGITPGAEPDRLTATQYLAGEHPDHAPAAAEDDTRAVTQDDVAEVDPVDDLWVAELDDRSPEIALDEPSPVTASPSPAHEVASVEPCLAQLDVLLAQASLAASVAADQASQDDAWQPEDDERRAELAADAGRARREAAEVEAAGREPVAAAGASPDPLALHDELAISGQSVDNLTQVAEIDALD